jgi:hypothetical protein
MIVAIDPGKSGGIAVLQGDGKCYCIPMPETEKDVVVYIRDLVNISESCGENIVVHLEKVGGFAGKAQPGSAMFTFGEGFGVLKGAILAFNIRLELVTPQNWQKALSLGTSKGLTKTQWKNKLKARAQELYPNARVTLSTADALLILEYARNKERGM